MGFLRAREDAKRPFLKSYSQLPTCKSTKSLQCLFGVQSSGSACTQRGSKDQVYGWMVWDERDIKSVLQLLHTLYVYRTCIYVLKKILKNCQQDSYGFQNLKSSWRWGNTIFEITLCTWVFKYLGAKVIFFLLIFYRLQAFFLKISKTYFVVQNRKNFGYLSVFFFIVIICFFFI